MPSFRRSPPLKIASSDPPTKCIACIKICDTWHHIGSHARYLALLKRMLKPGGQIVMIDFKREKTPMGPPMEMRIARADLVIEMESNGFVLVDERTFLPYQYFLVFKVK